MLLVLSIIGWSVLTMNLGDPRNLTEHRTSRWQMPNDICREENHSASTKFKDRKAVHGEAKP
jgi:hypothetical protein